MQGVPSLFTGWTPSKQGSEGARPVGTARAGQENGRRPQGGRQRDSPRLPSRSTAKTRRRLSMARSQLDVATAAAPKRSRASPSPQLRWSVSARRSPPSWARPRDTPLGGAGQGGARHAGGGR